MAARLPETPPFIEVAVEAVKRIQQPLLLYTILVIILLISLLMLGKDVLGELRPVVYALAVIIVLAAISHFALAFHKQRAEYLITKSEKQSPASLIIPTHIFARSDSAEFRGYIESLARESQRLVFIGTGLNILQRDPFVVEVMERAAEGHSNLEICMAHPASPDVETRLIEEEFGDMKPPVGQSGVFKHIDKILSIWRGRGYPETIRFKLFTHYPAFAFFIIDREYFVYPYEYTTLGNFSPVFHFSKDHPQDSSVIEYLEEQYRRIWADAQDARAIRAVQECQTIDAEDLYPFALYFIPRQDSGLYQFGNKVLGYDIRNGTSSSSH